MSSYIMHICISDIVKRKLNLTDKFIYGSVLPDNIKHITGDRNATHYIEQIIVDDEKRNLPNIQRAINELDIQDREIRAGYIAHLVEDLIWFNNYIPTYAKKLPNNTIQYLADNSIQSEKEFSKDVYSDYSNSSSYVVNKCDVDIDKLIAKLVDISENDDHMKPILDNTKYPKEADINNNKFMTKESMDRYIEECTKEVEKIVLKLMGE